MTTFEHLMLRAAYLILARIILHSPGGITEQESELLYTLSANIKAKVL